MKEGKTAETKGALPPAAKPELTPFQVRFNDALESWKKDGCQHILDSGTATERFCGAKPHGVKMDEPDAEGMVTMAVDCQAGHARQWEFKVKHDEMKDELARQREAALKAAEDAGKTKDPLKASVTITLDLRTQDVNIDPWVPTPGVGMQLAAMLMAHFQHQFITTMLMQRPKIAVPHRGIIDPKTGKPVVQ